MPAGSVAIQLLRWIVGLGVLGWVIRANGGWHFLQLPLQYPAAIAAFAGQVFVGGIVEAQRIRMLCGASVAQIPFAFAYRLVAVATLFNMAIPGGTGGDVLKLVNLAQRIPGRRAEFVAMLLLDRIVGMTSILVVALVAAWAAAVTGTASASVVGVVVAPALLLLGAVALAGVMSTRRPRTLLMRLVPERWKRLRGLLDRAFNTSDLLRSQPGVLARALAVSIVGQLVMATAFVIAARWLLPGAPAGLVASLAFIGLIVNAIPITPGGIGVGEAAFDGLFHLAGFDGGARLLLFWRLGQVPMAILGAWFFMRHSRAMTDPRQEAPLDASRLA